MIFQILDEAAVEYMRAPYHAWGQLAYMESHPDQLIHCICAGSEMLMWDVERVVLSMVSFGFGFGPHHYIPS